MGIYFKGLRRDIKLNQTEFIGIGTVNEDSRFNMESHT